MDEEDEHFLSASHRKCILLSGTECHIINYLLTELARAEQGNIGPWSFSYGPSAARSVLSRPRANIPQYGPRVRLVYIYIYIYLLYDKPSLRQIPVLWLALSWSGFCSTDRFHGNGPTRVFLFWSEDGKFKICNQNSEKKIVNQYSKILSFSTVKLLEEAKKIELFPKFQRWMKKTNFSKQGLLSWRSGNFWCRNWNRHHSVPYNKELTELARAVLGNTGQRSWQCRPSFALN